MTIDNQHIIVLALLCLACAACSSAAAVGSATAANHDAPRTPLLAYVIEDAALVGHFRGRELSQLPTSPALLALGDGDASVADDIEQACGKRWSELVDEMVISIRDEQVLLAVIPAVDRDAATACLEALDDDGQTETVNVDGRRALRVGDEEIAVYAGDVLLMGTESTVREALDEPPSADEPVDVFTKLGAPPDSMLRIVKSAESAALRGVMMSLNGFDGGTRLEIVSFFTTTEGADAYRSWLRATKKKTVELLRQHERSRARRVALEGLKSLDVRRASGGAVIVTASFVGSKDEQLESMESVVAIMDGWRRGAKKAQARAAAREQLDSIAERLAAYAENKRRMPASAPADWDHATWKALAYTPEQPSPYRFTIDTAVTRRSAIVRAQRDDVTLSVKVRIDHRGKAVIERP